MTHEHKACYGTMFHDTLHFESNTEMKGKVFSFELASIGLVLTDHLIKADISEWDDCLKCPGHRGFLLACPDRTNRSTSIRPIIVDY